MPAAVLEGYMSNPDELRLVEPSEELEGEYVAHIRELLEAGEHVSEDMVEAARGGFAAFVQGLRDAAAGRNLRPSLVPWNTYWLMLGKRMLGMSSLRHRLTPSLEDRGGHIGYHVRPSERRKGYGTRLLALTLEKARALGLRRVLLTCDPDNLASRRIIEKNGGLLAGEGICMLDGQPVRRYWIELGNTWGGLKGAAEGRPASAC